MTKDKSPRTVDVAIDAFKGTGPAFPIATIGLCGGFALTRYERGGDPVGINAAAVNVLFNCLANRAEFKGADFDVRPTTSTIGLASGEETGLAERLGEALKCLTTLQVTSQEFEDAKEKTLAKFKAAYKQAEFRAAYKAYEFLHANTGFSLQALIDDLQKIQHEDLTSAMSAVLTPGNVCVHVLGEPEPDLLASVLGAMDTEFLARDDVAWLAPGMDPYLLSDVHVVKLGRSDVAAEAVHLAFEDRSATPAERRLVADLFAVAQGMPPCVVCSDCFDTGLFALTKDPADLKGLLRMPSKEGFDEALRLVAARYGRLVAEQPRDYGSIAASSLVMGLNLTEYLAEIHNVSYEGFIELYDRLDPIVHEGQVMIRREASRG